MGTGGAFSEASEQEIQRTKFLLCKARRIDQEDLHADKTANATIMIEK